jgi:hypothetical protein
MYLFEFDATDPYATKIIAVVDQLKNDLESGKIKHDWHIKKLLKYFQKYDINLDPTDLYSMVKKAPLKRVIKNIQGDRVVFKGHESPGEIDKNKSDQTVKQMAKKALKK